MREATVAQRETLKTLGNSLLETQAQQDQAMKEIAMLELRLDDARARKAAAELAEQDIAGVIAVIQVAA